METTALEVAYNEYGWDVIWAEVAEVLAEEEGWPSSSSLKFGGSRALGSEPPQASAPLCQKNARSLTTYALAR